MFTRVSFMNVKNNKFKKKDNLKSTNYNCNKNHTAYFVKIYMMIDMTRENLQNQNRIRGYAPE